METRTITPEQKAALDRRLPDEAVSQHPTKKFLSSIKSIYVTERLNEVFGVGSWRVETEIVERSERMVVVKLRFSIPEYGIYYECFGGNDNADLGDACKGATTDALRDCCCLPLVRQCTHGPLLVRRKCGQQARLSGTHLQEPIK